MSVRVKVSVRLRVSVRVRVGVSVRVFTRSSARSNATCTCVCILHIHIQAEKWDQAVNLAAERMSEDSEGAKLIVERVATHLIQAREAAKAMEMFARTHLWDQAYDVAKTHLSESNLDSLMMKHAEHVASTGDYKQACEAMS